MIGVGIVGYGYWGPNLLRNFSEVPGCKVVSVSDLQDSRLAKVRARIRREVTIVSAIITDPRVDAVIVATGVPLRSRRALRAEARLVEADRHDQRSRGYSTRPTAAGSSSRGSHVRSRAPSEVPSSSKRDWGHLLLRLGA